MEPEELFDEWVEGTTHRDNQVDEHGVHLTVAAVHSPYSRGKIDFGGSELAPTSARALETSPKTPGDRYGWWRLSEGIYVVEFNETLREGAPPALLVSNQRLLNCGSALASAIFTSGEMRTLLTVGEEGIDIKENARIALLRPLSG